MSKDPRNEREAATAMGCGLCGGDCNQGRDCPERGDDAPEWAHWGARLSLAVGVALMGVAVWGVLS